MRRRRIRELVAAAQTDYTGELALVTPYLATVTHTKGGDRVHAADAPLRTVTTAKGGEFVLVSPTLIQTGYGERDGQAPRVPGLDKPLGTVVAGGQKHALVTAFLAKHYGNPGGAPRTGIGCDVPARGVRARRGEHPKPQEGSMKTEDLDRMDTLARVGSMWPESTQSRADVLALTAEVRRLTAELASVAAERDALRATVNDNAAVSALNAIASICGCPDWDYPGQLVRDVEALRTERDSARAEGRAAGLREALAIVVSYQHPSASPEPTELDHIVSVIGAALSAAEGGGA